MQMLMSTSLIVVRFVFMRDAPLQLVCFATKSIGAPISTAGTVVSAQLGVAYIASSGGCLQGQQASTLLAWHKQAPAEWPSWPDTG